VVWKVTPIAQGVHRPPTPAEPGGHSSQLPSGSISWLLAVVWVPSGHVLHALSLVGVGSAVTVEPASHVAWGAQLGSLVPAVKLVAWQARQTRFCTGVPLTTSCEPGWHTSHNSQLAALSVVLYDQAGHGMQIRSDTAVDPVVSCSP